MIKFRPYKLIKIHYLITYSITLIFTAEYLTILKVNNCDSFPTLAQNINCGYTLNHHIIKAILNE